jgi:hypothetical protein
MKLKSFGCSFIFGTDLADSADDDGRHLAIPAPSNLTWPAHLARHLGYDYECLARPGSGNLQIAERVLSHLADPEPSFYVIGWTWIDRFDYTNSTIVNRPIAAQWGNWKTLMPVDHTELAKLYYKGLHSEYRDKLTTLMQIQLVIDALNRRGQRFTMTHIDELMFDQQWNQTPAVLDLQLLVKPHMTMFEDDTFLDYSRKHKFEISPGLHPLEQAHKSAAQIIIDSFDKQKTIDPTRLALV